VWLVRSFFYATLCRKKQLFCENFPARATLFDTTEYTNSVIKAESIEDFSTVFYYLRINALFRFKKVRQFKETAQKIQQSLFGKKSEDTAKYVLLFLFVLANTQLVMILFYVKHWL